MTFFKRHWPDLIITSLILALLGGFALVFLEGENRTGATRDTQRTETPAPPTSAQQPETSIPTAPDAELPTIPGQDNANPATGRAPTAAAAEAPVPATQAEPPAAASEAGAAPEAGSGSADATEPVSPVKARASGAPVPTSRDDTPTRADYRLSAGVFGSEAVARERTATITALGYTVHLIPVQAGVVAQIGPFADRDTAARAAADIGSAYPNIALYPPVVRDQSTDVTTRAPTNRAETPRTETPRSENSDVPGVKAAPPPQTPTRTTTEASPEPKPTSPAPTRVAREVPGVPVYLQVGAFDRQESAAQLVGRLRGEGLSAEVNAPPGAKVRVLVGPLGGDALLSAEDKLQALGLAHFRVR